MSKDIPEIEDLEKYVQYLRTREPTIEEYFAVLHALAYEDEGKPISASKIDETFRLYSLIEGCKKMIQVNLSPTLLSELERIADKQEIEKLGLGQRR